LREDLLQEFPSLERYIYLNTASIGLVPRRTIEAIRDFSERVMREGSAYLDESMEEGIFEELRRASSRLMKCDEDDVAIFSSVTEAINSLAWALRGGRKIVSTSLEFPSLIYPWIRVGKEKNWSLELLKSDLLVDEDELLKRITEGVRAVCLSHVEFLTGQRLNLREIAERAHEVGSLLIVDGIQAAGCIPIDVKSLDVDFYVFGGYKWLLGPMGAAAAYIREELSDELEPGIVGWRSVEDMWSLDASSMKYARGARKFEYGTSSYDSKVGLAKSIEYLLEIGIESIHERDMRVSGRLMERIREIEGIKIVTPQNRGPIVTIEADRPYDLLKMMERGGRKLIASVRRGLIRFSIHLYNDYEDVEEASDRLAEAVKSLS
jgi:selenocysteine lyase/cysteine desulfurase